VLEHYSKFLDKVEKFIGGVIVFLLAAAFLVIFAQVLLRYVFAMGFPWTEELARFSIIWLSFLGASVAIRHRKHLCIDVIEARLSKKPRMALNVLTDLLLISFFIIMIVIGYQYAFANRSNISAGLRISMAYVYIALIVGMALCVLYAIELVWKRLATGEVHPYGPVVKQDKTDNPDSD